MCSCNRKFDPDKWQVGYSHDVERKYPNKRKKMLKDLLESHKLEGLSYDELVDMLGAPKEKEEINDTLRVSYPCGRGTVPWYDGHVIKRMLHLKISNDTVRSFEVENIYN